MIEIHFYSQYILVLVTNIQKLPINNNNINNKIPYIILYQL